MSARVFAIAVMWVLASCDAPPRDVTYFEGHRQEAERVLRGCEAGDRSAECQNARAAIGRLKANKRMERYRKGFE